MGGPVAAESADELDPAVGPVLAVFAPAQRGAPKGDAEGRPAVVLGGLGVCGVLGGGVVLDGDSDVGVHVQGGLIERPLGVWRRCDRVFLVWR